MYRFVIDQYTEGFRYRVLEGKSLKAGSLMFPELSDALNHMQVRFPGSKVTKFETHM